MRSLGILIMAALLASAGAAASAESGAAIPAPVTKPSQPSSTLGRDALDARAAHLARAALEAEQSEALSREELVSILVLMSLREGPPPRPS